MGRAKASGCRICQAPDLLARSSNPRAYDSVRFSPAPCCRRAALKSRLGTVSSPTAKPYAPVDGPQLDALLGDWPYKPFAGHGAWPAENLLDLTRTRVKNVLRNAQVVTWVPPSIGHGVHGLA